VELIKGKKTPQIHKILGDVEYDEVIHRDNMAMV
jgi:glutamate 5-kinase